MKKNLINYLIITLILLMILLKLTNSTLFSLSNSILNYICLTLVIITSIYFTIKLKFLQFNIPKIISTLKRSSREDINALFMSMGAKIGVGSIAGISLAIYIGGPGVIFWIWIWSLLASILTYCESYLGLKFKTKKNQGGVFTYINQGIKNKNLAIIYTFILIFVYAIGFIGIQSNTIVKSIKQIININPHLIVLFIMITVSIIIFNKINTIINFMSKLVPIMCILYIILGIIIIISNRSSFTEVLTIIITDALKSDKAIWTMILVALQRGIFATESGIGTSSIASSISNNSPQTQGIFQVIGTHFTSLVIISITSFIVIGSSYNYVGAINGIEIVISIFYNHYGLIGSLGLTIIIILFALSTIVSGYYYSIKGLEFIKGYLTTADYLFFKILIILLVFLGGLVESTIIWSLIDSLILLLLLINIYAIVKLRNNIS